MHKQRGFTLVELLVVIAIIGVLMTLGIANFTGAQRSARDAQRKNDLRAVQYALAEYFQDNASTYPNSGYSSVATQFGTNFNTLVTLLSSGTNPYLRNSSLADPRNGTTFYYTYEPLNSGSGYRLKACLEVATDNQGVAPSDPLTSPFTSVNCTSGRVYVATNP